MNQETDLGEQPCKPSLDGYCSAHPLCEAARHMMAFYERTLEQFQQEVSEGRQRVRATQECYEALVKKVKRSIETFELGAEVRVIKTFDTDLLGNKKDKTVTATITSICIDRSGVKYYIVWWANGRRHEERVDQMEIELVQDTLPLTSEGSISSHKRG